MAKYVGSVSTPKERKKTPNDVVMTKPITAKWILCSAMILGRLELFTVLVLFTPSFWKY